MRQLGGWYAVTPKRRTLVAITIYGTGAIGGLTGAYLANRS